MADEYKHLQNGDKAVAMLEYFGFSQEPNSAPFSYRSGELIAFYGINGTIAIRKVNNVSSVAIGIGHSHDMELLNEAIKIAQGF